MKIDTYEEFLKRIIVLETTNNKPSIIEIDGIKYILREKNLNENLHQLSN